MTDDDAGVRMGVDVGGTFTDVVTVEDGVVRTGKTPSTPDDPAEGVLSGVHSALSATRGGPDAVTGFVHGTTVATNAVLEASWAPTALVTTAGFGDVLEIGRQERPSLYDFDAEKPAPVVPRDRRFEVAERVDERGDVDRPVDEDDLARVVEAVADSGAESVAVCTLFSFETPAHERRVGRALEEGTEAAVSLSSEVHPEIREYERTLVTAINAALEPVLSPYLDGLDDALSSLGVAAPFRVMGSSGGVMTAGTARERPVRTLLSGPAAGVAGAVAAAGGCGGGLDGAGPLADFVAMDMGGTSCDVSLVEDGEPTVTTDVTVGDYPVAVPTVDVHTVGAGGGSVAWIDEGGALRVGPRSAGARPGPACYGRGGTAPTTTDAQVVLGRLDPDALLPSSLDPDPEAAREAVREGVAAPLDTTVEAAAEGVVAVAEANLRRALRVVSVDRGRDPRELALVAYGGAGPVHAPGLAASLSIPLVVVPRHAGVLSALGLLESDVRHDHSTSRVRRLSDVDPRALTRGFADLRAEADRRLDEEGVPDRDREFSRAADLRYAGQAHELTVTVPGGDLTAAAVATVERRFHDRHERRYGHAARDEPVELVTLRLRAGARTPSPSLPPLPEGGSVADARRERRAVRFDGESRTTPVYRRADLPPTAELPGPAVVESAESTTVVPPDQCARVDDVGNLLVEVSP